MNRDKFDTFRQGVLINTTKILLDTICNVMKIINDKIKFRYLRKIQYRIIQTELTHKFLNRKIVNLLVCFEKKIPSILTEISGWDFGRF